MRRALEYGTSLFHSKEKDFWQVDTKDKIKEFVYIPSLKIISVPDELENEPYSIKDSGLRPELRVLSVPFRFKVENKRVICKIGNTAHSRKLFAGVQNILPGKCISDVSILDIYQNYGLDITYSFLSNIYYNPISRRMPLWLITYLEGSMLSLGLKIEYKLRSDKIIEDILSMSRSIILKLISMDNSSPKLLVPLAKVEQCLSFEILAEIIGSMRICKNITDIVQYMKSIEEPTEAELSCVWTKSYITYSMNNIHRCMWIESDMQNESIYHEYMLKKDNHFYLTHLINSDINNKNRTNFEVSQYSLTDYKEAYKKRGLSKCQVTAAVLSLLDKISKMKIDSDETNCKKVCGWLLQLSVDTGSEFKGELENIVELELALNKVAIYASELEQIKIQRP